MDSLIKQHTLKQLKVNWMHLSWVDTWKTIIPRERASTYNYTFRLKYWLFFIVMVCISFLQDIAILNTNVVDQINRILDVLGTPTEDVFAKISSDKVI